jgi:hypothetical protein
MTGCADVICSPARPPATGAALLPLKAANAARERAATVEDVLLGRHTLPPVTDRQMTAQFAAARADFRACRYTHLAHRLPHLLARATAGRAPAVERPSPRST